MKMDQGILKAVKRRKIKIRNKKLFIGIWVCIILLFLFFANIVFWGSGVFIPMPYRHLDGFLGRVIDAETKNPIEGAAVLAVYHKSVPSISGISSFTVDCREALTDENGEFKIPSKNGWFVLNRGFTEGNLIIFKPGYGTFPDHKLSEAINENKSWPPPEKYILYELPKLKTREERRKNVIHMDSYMKPLYIHTINEERKSLGLRLIDISDKEK